MTSFKNSAYGKHNRSLLNEKKGKVLDIRDITLHRIQSPREKLVYDGFQAG